MLLIDDGIPLGEFFFQPTIAFSSPRCRRVEKFLEKGNGGARQLIMPPWSLAEMLQAATILELDQQAMTRQYDIWGGVWGPVMNSGNFPKHKLDEFVQSIADPQDMVKSIVYPSLQQCVPHCLVHFDTPVSELHCMHLISHINCGIVNWRQIIQ